MARRAGRRASSTSTAGASCWRGSCVETRRPTIRSGADRRARSGSARDGATARSGRAGGSCFVNERGDDRGGGLLMQSQKIDLDHRRFREIVRGKIKQNLRKYITQGEMIGKKGKDMVSIPLPQIDIPHFRYGDKQPGGVGQGDGDAGRRARAGRAEAGRRAGRRSARRAPARGRGHAGGARRRSSARSSSCRASSPRATSASSRGRTSTPASARTGPESLRHFRRTFKQALRRQIAMGTYDPKNPLIVPIRDDKRYRIVAERSRCRSRTRSSST